MPTTWYARRPGFHKSGLRRYAAVACFFALALLSKPQVIAFPFLVWLWDYWPLSQGRARAVAGPAAQGASMSRLWSGWLVLEKLPLLLLSAASAVDDDESTEGRRRGPDFFPVQPALAAGDGRDLVCGLYWGKRSGHRNSWPCLPHPAKLYPAWQVGTAVVLLLLVTAWVIRARDQRYLAVGWFWYLGSFVPMIGLVQVGYQAMADRYAYIPFIGLFLMLTWLAADWTPRLINSAFDGSPFPRLLVCWCWEPSLYRQVGYWHDTQSILAGHGGADPGQLHRSE